MYSLKYNIKYKVIYFALEESKEEFIDSLFLHVLTRKYKISIDRFALTGLRDVTMTDLEINAIENCAKDVEAIMSRVIIVDYCYKPTAIYNKCRSIAESLGSFSKNSKGNEVYKSNDPNEIVLVVCDHISLIEPEYDAESKTMTTHPKAISRWHTDYARKVITKKWKWACLNIQQQSLESEKQQFTAKGETVINKILPSLDGVANNREVIRDDYVVFGIFSPERYELENFRGYKILNPSGVDCFQDNYRSVHVLKNRLGTPNKTLSLYFDGSYTFFEELPIFNDSAKLSIIYKKINLNRDARSRKKLHP